jgi:hypothetical protein
MLAYVGTFSLLEERGLFEDDELPSSEFELV